MITSLKKACLAAMVSACGAALAPALAGAAAPTATQYVRGTVDSVTDKSLAVNTSSGTVTIGIQAPLTIYTSQPSDLAHVKSTSFVGITSVKQADGTELAKEIHIFPEALRGLGEGSHMMDDAGGKPTSNRMTNGNVASAHKSPTPKSGSRMTNGTVQSAGAGAKLTLDYGNGTQPITVPADVPVTIIAPAQTKLSPGQRIVALAKKDAGGALTTSQVMISRPPARKK